MSFVIHNPKSAMRIRTRIVPVPTLLRTTASSRITAISKKNSKGAGIV